jgi:Holliday junction DNA helicase RuvA
MSADEIVSSIRTNNLARLTSIPGVGRKTAERLVVELRDKVAALTSTGDEGPIAATAGGEGATVDTIRDDALSALINLGYPRASAEKAISSAMRSDGDLSVETILRRSLQMLAKG